MFTNLYNFYRSKEWKALCEQLMLERVSEDGDIICEHCGKPIVNAYDCISAFMFESDTAIKHAIDWFNDDAFSLADKYEHALVDSDTVDTKIANAITAAINANY